MGLFGNLFGKSKNYAKLYMDAVHEVNPDKAHKVFIEWGKQSGCENDANYLLTVVFYGVIAGTSESDLEVLLKRVSRYSAVDPSLESSFRSLTRTTLIKENHQDLADRYL